MTDTQPPAPDLDTIQARTDAATHGPWNTDARHPKYIFGADGPVVARTGTNPTADADAAFIAHARTDVPALIAYARHLEARVAELEQQLAQAENTNARTLANELVTNKPQAECGAPHPVAADTHCERQPGHDGGHAAIANAWPIAQWPFAPVPARDGR